MAEKPKEAIPDARINIFEDRAEPVVASDGYTNIKRSERGPSVGVESRSRNLLFAVNALGSAVQRETLPTAVEKVPGKREELEARYNDELHPEVLDQTVLPGATKNKKKFIESAEQDFKEAFGDDLAVQAAWAHFSPAEKAELELSGKYPDLEESQKSFKVKMTSRRRETQGEPTKGSIARAKVRRQASETLHRIHDQRKKDEADTQAA